MGMNSFFPEASFQSWDAYRNALRSTCSRFRARAFARAKAENEVQEVALRSKNSLNRTLNWWDIMWISVGGIVGSGIFVITGEETRNVAGPAILISYIIAGISAMLSALCYTEFAIEVPVAGGSFAFLRIELGEFIAFLAAGNLILEFILSQGATARGWTSSFAALINKRPDDIRIYTSKLPHGFNFLDPIASGAILIFGLPAVFSTRFTSTANWIASTVNMLIIGFIIVGGLIKGDVANLAPFIPFGVKGIFTASTVVYYAYLGFDSVATLGEEIRNPPRDIPCGLLGSLALIIVMYCLMVLALCMLQPYSQVDTGAPFAFAFASAGWKWAQYLVALAALKGMTTVLLLGILSEARYITHIARTHVIPPWFAYVDPRTQTPIRATLMLMVCGALVGLFTSLDVLANLFSISTLSIFVLVAVSILVRRYYLAGETPVRHVQLMLFFVLVGGLACVGMTVYFQLGGTHWLWYTALGLVWVVSTVCIQVFVPQARKPKTWGIPVMPWIPCASVAVNVFLLGAIDRASYVRFGVMTVVILAYYFLVGLHASYETASDSNVTV